MFFLCLHSFYALTQLTDSDDATFCRFFASTAPTQNPHEYMYFWIRYPATISNARLILWYLLVVMKWGTTFKYFTWKMLKFHSIIFKNIGNLIHKSTQPPFAARQSLMIAFTFVAELTVCSFHWNGFHNLYPERKQFGFIHHWIEFVLYNIVSRSFNQKKVSCAWWF